MITSYTEYLDYLEQDRIALGKTMTLRHFIFDDIWKFQRVMRKLEYLTNCHGNKILKLYYELRYRALSNKLGFSIPINIFGPALSIAHKGTIVINERARIGSHCRIHVCVNIGANAGDKYATPTIGNHSYIGPGVKMYGKIILGNNIRIGANAVVNKNFLDNNLTIAGVPAKIVSYQK